MGRPGDGRQKETQGETPRDRQGGRERESGGLRSNENLSLPDPSLGMHCKPYTTKAKKGTSKNKIRESSKQASFIFFFRYVIVATQILDVVNCLPACSIYTHTHITHIYVCISMNIYIYSSAVQTSGFMPVFLKI